MKRYELKTTQTQKNISLHKIKRFYDNEEKVWTCLFEMSCEGYKFNFYIDKGKSVLDFLVKENQAFDGDTKEIQSYLSYMFE